MRNRARNNIKAQTKGLGRIGKQRIAETNSIDIVQ